MSAGRVKKSAFRLRAFGKRKKKHEHVEVLDVFTVIQQDDPVADQEPVIWDPGPAAWCKPPSPSLQHRWKCTHFGLAPLVTVTLVNLT